MHHLIEAFAAVQSDAALPESRCKPQSFCVSSRVRAVEVHASVGDVATQFPTQTFLPAIMLSAVASTLAPPISWYFCTFERPCHLFCRHLFVAISSVDSVIGYPFNEFLAFLQDFGRDCSLVFFACSGLKIFGRTLGQSTAAAPQAA